MLKKETVCFAYSHISFTVKQYSCRKMDNVDLEEHGSVLIKTADIILLHNFTDADAEQSISS